MCKPDMRSRASDGSPAEEIFRDWSREIGRLASFSNIYMKLSGGFSEMGALPASVDQGPWDSSLRQRLVQDARDWAEKWMKQLLITFGARRVMFGSDWPVCNVGGGDNEVSWMNWWSVVEGFVKDNLSEDDQAQLWSGNAIRAYCLNS